MSKMLDANVLLSLKSGNWSVPII